MRSMRPMANPAATMPSRMDESGIAVKVSALWNLTTGRPALLRVTVAAMQPYRLRDGTWSL